MSTQLQVSATHYDFLHYESAERYASYWYQIHTILSLHPQSVLEIGIGSGLTRSVLERCGVSVLTADIDKALGADTEADVRDLPFGEGTFDVAAAFEILEHVPFADFPKALGELRRVSKKFVCISMPNVGRYMEIVFRTSYRMSFRRIFDLSFLGRPLHRFDGQHYWEINKRGFDMKTVRNAITESGLKIRQEIRPRENLYHHFFVLEK